MRRQDKYPDTSTFHYYNANPHNRITTDCNIRAISTATNIDYNVVVKEMAELQIKTGYDVSSPKLIDMYLEKNGWHKRPQPKKYDGTKYTGKEFCKVIVGNIIANIGGHHIVAIREGKVWDIWDSTDKCIGNYWVRG